MNDDTIATLRQKEQQVLTLLDEPTTTKEIAAALGGIDPGTVRDHIKAIRDAGVPLGERWNSDGAKEFYRSEETRDALSRYLANPMTSKATHTKAKKDLLLQLQEWAASDLTGRRVATVQPPVRESHEDMVVHRSDDHAGAWYVNDGEENAYDKDIFAERVRTVNEKTFSLKRRQEAAGVDFDTLHIVFGGDGVHGEGIHGDQPWETQLNLVEQVEHWTDLYMEFIDRATEEFPFVNIVCQRGNHGELRGDGMSPGANADDLCFLLLEKRILDRGYDNVQIRWNQHDGYFINFRMRVDHEEDARRHDALGLDESEPLPPAYQTGHRALVRHGQNSLFHVGTSSGENRWRGWFSKHRPDIAYRGHYHTFRYESLDNIPIIMSGSICPPDDYEESFASWEEPAATVHGVSDERPVTWFYPVDFADT